AAPSPPSQKKTSTLSDWAKETGGGGGSVRGRLPPVPVKVEVVSRADWDPAGIRPKSMKEEEAAGTKGAAAAGPVRERVQIPPLQADVFASAMPYGRGRQSPLPLVGSRTSGPGLLQVQRRTMQSTCGCLLACCCRLYGEQPLCVPLSLSLSFSFVVLDGNTPLWSRVLPPPSLPSEAFPFFWRGGDATDASTKLASSSPSKCTKPNAAAAGSAAGSATKEIERLTKEGAAAAASVAAPEVVGGGDEDSGLFELAYAIAHDGGGVVKCRWAPDGSSDRGVGVDAAAAAAAAGGGGG
ncbi:unnamed protein product, partial [Hapterophycus canaliculatus]